MLRDGSLYFMLRDGWNRSHLKEAKKRKRKKAKKRKRQSHENVTSAKKSKFEIIGDNSSQNVRSWSSLYIAAANHKFVSLETKLHLERRGEPVIGWYQMCCISSSKTKLFLFVA